MAVNKEIRELLRDVQKQGFDVVSNKSHYKIKLNGATIATLPSTPGGGGHCVKQIIRRTTKRLIEAGYKGELRW